MAVAAATTRIVYARDARLRRRGPVLHARPGRAGGSATSGRLTDANGCSLDFMDVDIDITPMHYAFLVSEPEFDAAFPA